jgi:hypothetical protein
MNQRGLFIFILCALGPIGLFAAPILSSLNPTTAVAGGPSFTLTITGTDFTENCVAQWNGANRDTVFVDSSQLTAFIPEGDVVAAGDSTVTVLDQGPDGETSNGLLFSVSAPNPVPSLTNISPQTVLAGSANFSLVVTGLNFTNESVVRWNGENRSTVYFNPTFLIATILAEDVLTAGTPTVTVFTPAPGGGASNGQVFTIQGLNPVPTLLAVSPSTVTIGGPDFTLTVTGTQFVSNSVVQWNGIARETTFVSGTVLTAIIFSGDIGSAGFRTISVLNPAPGGGTSNPQVVLVQNLNPTPVVTSLNPNSAFVGGENFDLTITGSNFINDSVVFWNGQSRPTTFINSSFITASISENDISSEEFSIVTVANPLPGGGTSNGQVFTVQSVNSSPNISSLLPTSVLVGGPAFTLAVTGSNFINTSVVQWNGANRTTTFVSATRLTAAIPASDIVSAGVPFITVLTPAPGGGTSNIQLFTIQALNPLPALLAVIPSSVTIGGPSFLLTVVGSNFITDSEIRWNGGSRATTFVSPNRLFTTIAASDIRSIGIRPITVFNPAPGGGTSTNRPLSVVFEPVATDPLPGGAPALSDLAQARAFPNPWAANQHGGVPITFDRLTQDATVKIFTLSAEWVKSLNAGPGETTWDLTNDAGEHVASGYYIYLITDPEGRKTKGKVAIIK